jgi:hypothetical protein
MTCTSLGAFEVFARRSARTSRLVPLETPDVVSKTTSGVFDDKRQLQPGAENLNLTMPV